MSKIVPLITEADLVRGCQKGDRTCQKAVFEKWHRKMLAVCQRYINNNFEAEDILMQAMMKVFTEIGRFSGEGSFEGWIRRIVVNEALMAVRKQKLVFETVVEEGLDLAGGIDSGSLQVEAEYLLELLQNLPTGYRTVFNLYAIEGYDHKEIANLLGISEGTSKSQLSRARQMLTDKLNKMNKSENQSARP
jgi:RNA polymerase sigma-70 factor (ECF subfamily)